MGEEYLVCAQRVCIICCNVHVHSDESIVAEIHATHPAILPQSQLLTADGPDFFSTWQLMNVESWRDDLSHNHMAGATHADAAVTTEIICQIRVADVLTCNI